MINLNRKEKITAFINSKKYFPLTRDEMIVVLDVPETDIVEFNRIINEIVEDGLAFESKKGRLMPSRAQNGLTGIFCGNEKRFGFVEVEGEEKDIFIPATFTNGAMHGDKVLYKILSAGTDEKRAEGKIIKVLERKNKTLVCTLYKKFKGLEAVPDNKKIFQFIKIPFGKSMGAKKGQKVVVEILSYPTRDRFAEGKVVEIIGKADTPEAARKSVMLTYGLPEEFPVNVLKEADSLPECVSDEMIKGRRDLRDKIIFTIDGADAKDLDDAVSIEKDKDGNYILGVHIADVTHYVKEGSAINREAINRGTSVYLAGSVIPMLPKKLSNGICSLNGGVDRLTLSVEMKITPNGEIIDHEIFESVINTTERMTYDDVALILEGDVGLKEKYNKIYPSLIEMKKLAMLLRKKRFSEGSIDFDFPETKIIFDEYGDVVDITKYNYTIANNMIEEFMLAANRTVAEHFFWLDLPFVYRTHETPSEEKISSFLQLCGLFGITVKDKADNIHSKTLQQILLRVKDTPAQAIISNAMLRSMMKAKYTTECSGHFGLNEKYYCHFTSPIRRLADLAIHRIIKSHIHGRNKDFSEFASLAAKNASDREIIAEEAESLSKKIITAQFMYSYVGAEFSSTIVSITQSSFFVELENGVQGRVSLADLYDYYTYSEKTYSLISDSKEYKIGDSVNVVLVRSDKITGEIDFIPSDEI